MYLEYRYRITYGNGQSYDRTHELRIPVSKEEYKTVMLGVIKEIPIREIIGIDDVIFKMSERVHEMDRYINLNGSLRNTPLKKQREITELDYYLPPAETQRIMKMADPVAVFDRPEEHMTLYRNDGSTVTLSSENGKMTIYDSKNKNTYRTMDVEHFLSYFIY